MGFTWTSIGCRHLVALVGFLTFCLINVQRLSTSIVVVAMVKHTYKDFTTHTNSSKVKICATSNNSTNILKNEQVENEGLDWSSEMQGYVFGAYFFGRIAALFPSAKLSRIFQARRVALCGCILASLATLLGHVAAKWNIWAFIAVQLARGVGAGAMQTPFFALMANWFPTSERGLLSTFVLTGYSVGAILATLVAGWICNHPSLGWPVVFYASGLLGIFHAFLMANTLYEMPSRCPRISAQELIYLTSNEKQVAMKKKISPPWRSIWTSVPFYALIVGSFGYYWTLSYFWSMQATFFGTVQQYTITKSSYMSALPFLFKAGGEYFTSSISHLLLNKGYVRVNKLRKGCNTIGCIGICASFLGFYYGECDGRAVTASSLLAMFFVGMTTLGAGIACMDMAPRFAGSLAGILNTIGGSSSFLLPVIVGKLTTTETLEEWQVVFFIFIAVVLFCGLIFALFGSADVQPWNTVDDDQTQNEITLANVGSNRGTK